jgi:hypothetical protein
MYRQRWKRVCGREPEMGTDKLITVIVPQGWGMPLLQALYERRVLRAALGTARAPSTYTKGSGALARTVRLSVEKDVLHVVAPAEGADEIFTFLYDSAGIGEAPGGFMFMGALSQASEFTLDLKPGPGEVTRSSASSALGIDAPSAKASG